MSEPRKECYKCLYYKKCMLQVDYKSEYCNLHRQYEKTK